MRVPALVWALVALVVLSTVMLVVSREDTFPYPSISNTRPSGLAALAALLKRDGIEVVRDRRAFPDLRENDLAVYIDIGNGQSFSEETPEIEIELSDWVEEGGHLLSANLGLDFNEASLRAELRTVTRTGSDRTLEVTWPQRLGFGMYWTDVDHAYPTWVGESERYAWVGAHGDGFYHELVGALPLTNRFLDEGQNAALALTTIRAALPEGGRVVFVETHLSSGGAGLLAELGSWAVFAKWQALLLLFMAVLMLGRRFGLPAHREPAASGSRELVDAMALMLRRTRRPRIAVSMYAASARRRIRAKLRLPKDADLTDNPQVPAELREALLACDALPDKAKIEAVHAAGRLERELAVFETSRATSR